MGYHRTHLIGARGDPFVHKKLLKLGGKALGIIGKVAPGPIGTVARALTGGGGRITAAPLPQVPTQIAGGGAVAFPGGAVGFGGTMTRGLPAMAGAPSGADGCPKGFHLNRTGYYTRAGFVPPRSKCVRNRSMNPANGRALRRALRREEQFVRLARRTGLVALPKARRLRKGSKK